MYFNEEVKENRIGRDVEFIKNSGCFIEEMIILKKYFSKIKPYLLKKYINNVNITKKRRNKNAT